jgi:DNA-binding HxlR family transcriptional regulator
LIGLGAVVVCRPGKSMERRLRERPVSLETDVAPPRSTPVPGASIPLPPRPPLETALEAVGDRHRLLIVWYLFWGPRSFCDLVRDTAGITKKARRVALVDMEMRGLVRRDVPLGAGGRAEYSLTPLGETLKPIIAGLYEWGLRLRGFPLTDVPFPSATQKRV